MFSKLKNLNNSWVITSRHNGNIFFKRRYYITRLKNYPDEQCLYYDKVSAENELAKLNEVRKKCKFQLENASKYFVNSFAYYWNDEITNLAIPIKNVQEKNAVIKDSSKLEEEVLNRIISNIKNMETSIQEKMKDLSNLKIKLEETSKINFEEILKPYETQGDRIVKVLFSKKEKI